MDTPSPPLPEPSPSPAASEVPSPPPVPAAPSESASTISPPTAASPSTTASSTDTPSASSPSTTPSTAIPPAPSPSSQPALSPTAAALASANAGFDALFANEIGTARAAFRADSTPFHLLGLGVVAFLEAALGMESGLMGEAAKLLAASEAGARRAAADAKKASASANANANGTNANGWPGRGDGGGRFAAGLEWEILGADAVVLLGLTHALGESYMGYFQCMYSLNAAHGRFTRLWKTVFPRGVEGYRTPAGTPGVSRRGSGEFRGVEGLPGGGGGQLADHDAQAQAARDRLERERAPEGPVEEMIVAGTAFGFGLFNLVFSLLPKKVQSLVGLLGFKHDRALALQALAVSAGVTTLGGPGNAADVHGVFAGLVLMTFHGVVLLLTYRAIVDSIEARYPTGALWILNRAKIMRMSNDATGAIAVLQRALEAPQTFVQADTLLVFELAWTLLAQRRHQEAADAFVRLTELNSWSHATYYFIAAGCYVSMGARAKAQELLDALPELLARKKIGGKDLPTEVLIRKKLEFYKEKQKRRGGDPAKFVECISISPSDELSIFWNTFQRIDDAVAEAHIAELAALSPHVALAEHSPFLPAVDEKHAVTAAAQLSRRTQLTTPQTPLDLDTPDERALRALLLGIMHRTLRLYAPARALFEAARGAQGVKVSTWIAGVALFELAVNELKEAQATLGAGDAAGWARVLAGADARLDGALGIAGKSDIDLSSRLDSRIALLRDEIAAKRAMVGV
ncbi:hypothetical protein B0H15DRAFT_940506 [Mycena belliarum]|uniref:Uncharacterized protein n=1 Tax=Mycena belliarum TaxID=1033014 RepID=A0AAD6TZT6_9AGAR|nr:hypothetical protein B0H15DRAFT_940506 [Mycena belliae]